MLESLFTEKNAVTFLQIFSAVVCSLLAQSKEDNFLHYYYIVMVLAVVKTSVNIDRLSHNFDICSQWHIYSTLMKLQPPSKLKEIVWFLQQQIR